MNVKVLTRLGLLPRIIIAIALGIGAGMVAPDWLAALCATFNGIFGQFLGFLIPLIIIGFVTPAIGDIGKGAGKMLLTTVALAYSATFLAGAISYFTGAAIFPDIISPEGALATASEAATSVRPWFTVDIPPLMGVMTALVLSFTVGIGIAYTQAGALGKAARQFRDIVDLTIRGVIIPLLPVYIFGIFLAMTMEGQVAAILQTFVKVIAVIFVLHIGILLLQYSIAGAAAKRNPLKMLRTMLPAYMTALGTQSSAATIPVTLKQTIKTGVNESVAGFVIPLCATIHMSGSALKIVACALALMIYQGVPYDAGMFLQLAAMLGIAIVAAPGIPGGAIMASLGILSSILGFSEEMNALMIALYIAMDNFGTACNVTGDCALATLVDRLSLKDLMI
ncbi:MAG: dicarboxylate/amino acid:cation symporter [Bacteroidales bacterium]|nr:dicarboxylate/amino acid:cation symporter [Bacteroidales bacterium]MCD8393244.1 dicarboxylate/amino acid:cation symporter [Bacteroidales bacterium]